MSYCLYIRNPLDRDVTSQSKDILQGSEGPMNAAKIKRMKQAL